MERSDFLPSLPPASPGTSEEAQGRSRPATDLRAAAQLATEAVLGTTRLVEAVHAAVWATVTPGPTPPGSRTAGLTGWIYRTVRGITHLSGRGTTWALGSLDRILDRTPRPSTDARQRLLSVLNGVVGDHLAASGSPLALPFSLHAPDGHQLNLDSPETAFGDTVVVFVHGLCLNDRDWMDTAGERTSLIEAVPAVLNGTAVLTRYNTGRSVRDNGEALGRCLTALTDRPAGPSRIVLVTHSMGGLVARSAIHHARRTAARWPELVTETVYLGTPHRGAPLERTGAWIEAQLRRFAVTAPFAGLTDLRSQGIQDLRRGTPTPNASAHTSGRTLYVAAALTTDRRTRDAIGDGLVPLSSALNRPDGSGGSTRRVIEGLGHLHLLDAPAVTEYLCDWLSAAEDSA
jgi:pimeloyl-ACP methyl ester carboxylesterase